MIFCLAFTLQNKSFSDGITCLQSGSRSFLLLLLLHLLSLNLLQLSGICPSVLLSEAKVEGLTLSPSELAPLVLIHILSAGLCCDPAFMPCGRSYSPHRHRQKHKTSGKKSKIVTSPSNQHRHTHLQGATSPSALAFSAKTTSDSLPHAKTSSDFPEPK